ncbi:hypothetical protein GJAV_G00103540 [Gymnothorax javanicus]|nr:hypothetical protein GJAV_G00103540 [Gymnothorax javanicus]
MSFSVTKGEGVTVFTVTSDPGSKCPMLCQILEQLCCSPTCFVSGKLRKLLDGPLSSLATVQIMVGLLTIGLGAFLMSFYDGPYFMWYIGAPYWLAACFIISGIFTLFGQRFSSPCLVFLTAFVNLVSAVLAVVAIVFYAADEGGLFFWACRESDRYDRYEEYDVYGYRRTRVNLTDVERHAKKHNLKLCRMYRSTVVPATICLKALLVAIAALQLCVCISVAVLAIKALKKNAKGENRIPEDHQPLIQEEVTANPVS